MPQNLSGEIMEISGLGQAQDQGGTGSPNYAVIILGTLIGGAVVYCLINRCMASSGGSLGMIKRCRKMDMKPGRRSSAQRWCLWDSKGKRVLGRHPSRSKADRQERLIQARKHGAL